MNNIYFTADPHLGHTHIIKYSKRYFCLDNNDINQLEYMYSNNSQIQSYYIKDGCVQKMDTILCENINATVDKGDLLYIIGDFCFARDFETVKTFKARIRCKNVHLILGNHDRFPKTKYRQIFDSVEDYKEIKINNRKIILTHYPMISWNGAFDHGICLHGHCHGRLEKWKQNHIPGLPLIDVGIDVEEWGYKPVSLNQIFDKVDLIETKYKGKNTHPEYYRG